METNQTTKMVAWLDEERRKDKALISKLEERTASQAALIEEQARRLQEFEGSITGLRSTLLTVSMFDETIARLRIELNTALEQKETKRSSVDQDLKKMRDIDREATVKAIEELRQEMIGRIDRGLQPRKSEEERLSRVAVELQSYADNLSKGLEEFERSLTFLEEQRRQDTRRISDINGEVAEIAKRGETHQAKLELLEELSRRNERNVTEMTSTLTDFKQQRQKWMEEQSLIEHQRERTMQDMVRRMDSFADEMVAFGNQVETWADTHRSMKQQVADFERIADRVDRRLNELSEVQRLSEERFRQEWDDFMSDDQKRWRQFTLTNEETWRKNEKAQETLMATVTQVQEHIERQADHIQFLSKTQQDLLTALVTQVQALREQFIDRSNAMPSLK